MSLRIVRAKPIEVPLREDTGYQLRMADLEPYLHDQVRALVLVSPNNPSGAVHDPERRRWSASCVLWPREGLC
jgi:aminotransferase